MVPFQPPKSCWDDVVPKTHISTQAATQRALAAVPDEWLGPLLCCEGLAAGSLVGIEGGSSRLNRKMH